MLFDILSARKNALKERKGRKKTRICLRFKKNCRTFVNKNQAPMKDEFCAERLKSARLAARLSLEELSVLTDKAVTRQSLSNYETKRMCPRESSLCIIAKALGVSPEYFKNRGLKIDMPTLRSTSYGPLTAKEERQIQNTLVFLAERYINYEKQARMTTSFHNPLQGFEVSNQQQAELSALMLREHWQLGNGAITSVCRLFERKGIKVLEAELPCDILGLSTWGEKQYPLIVLNDDRTLSTPERTRFTLLHELGHLLLTIAKENKPERLCNQFAACFLLPRATLIEEVGSQRDFVTMDEAIDLHKTYGISVAALIHQMKDLCIISNEHYNYWFDEIINKNKIEKGWGQYPFDERPQREKRIISIINHSKHIGEK